MFFLEVKKRPGLVIFLTFPSILSEFFLVLFLNKNELSF